MSKQQQSESTGKIAVVGERELAIGYNLLGIEDTFITSGEEASKTIQDLFASGNYSLIIVSDAVRSSLPAIFRKKNRIFNRTFGDIYACFTR